MIISTMVPSTCQVGFGSCLYVERAGAGMLAKSGESEQRPSLSFCVDKRLRYISWYGELDEGLRIG